MNIWDPTELIILIWLLENLFQWWFLLWESENSGVKNTKTDIPILDQGNQSFYHLEMATLNMLLFLPILLCWYAVVCDFHVDVSLILFCMMYCIMSLM